MKKQIVMTSQLDTATYGAVKPGGFGFRARVRGAGIAQHPAPDSAPRTRSV